MQLCYDGHVHAQLFPYVLTNTAGMTLLKVATVSFYDCLEGGGAEKFYHRGPNTLLVALSSKLWTNTARKKAK